MLKPPPLRLVPPQASPTAAAPAGAAQGGGSKPGNVATDVTAARSTPRPAGTSVRVCNVATKCTTRGELIAAFAAFGSDDALFVPARVTLEVGAQIKVKLLLKDGSTVLEVGGDVKEVHSEGTGTLGKAGILVRIKHATPENRKVLDEMASCRRGKSATEAPRRPPRKTQLLGSSDHSSVTTRSPAQTDATPDANAANAAHAANAAETNAAPPSFNDTKRLDAIASEAALAPAPKAAGQAVPPTRPALGQDIPSFDDQTVRRAPEEMGLMANGRTAVPEQRTPGSPYQLPANPFSDVTTNALNLYVEATLTEDEPTGVADDAYDDTALDGETDLATALQSAPPSPNPALALHDSHSGEVTARALVRSPVPAWASPALAPASWKDDTSTEIAPAGNVLVGARRMLGVKARALAPVLTKLRPHLRWAGPVGGAAVFGLLLGYLTWGGAPTAPTKPAVTAQAVTAAAARDPAPRTLATPPPGPEAPKVGSAPRTPAPSTLVPSPKGRAGAPTAAPTAAGRATPTAPPRTAAETTADLKAPASAPIAGRCLARVDSRPAGAIVKLGRKKIGRTPLLQAAVPCGAVVLSLERSRYEPVQENFTATPQHPSVVSVRLERPLAKLTVTSSPDNAALKVNGQLVGRTPRTVSVSRFETARIETMAAGGKPWKKTIYVKAPLVKLHAQLGSAAAPAAGKAPVPPATKAAPPVATRPNPPAAKGTTAPAAPSAALKPAAAALRR